MSSVVVKDFLYLFFTLSHDVVALIRHCFFSEALIRQKTVLGVFSLNDFILSSFVPLPLIY